MSDISVGARASVLALQNISAQMAQLQIRLATGKKVNDPTDNPSAYFTAAGLNSQAASLSTLLDGIGNVTSTITAASNAIASIKSLVTQAQTLANDALATTGSTAAVAGSLTLTTGSTIASNTGSASRFKTGDTVTVSDGTTTATYTAANNDTLQTFLNAVNNTAGLNVTASLNSSGKVELDGDAGITVTVGGSLNGAGGATLTSVLGLTAGATAPNVNSTRTSYATQFNSLLSQINSLANDASFNGVNLLSGGSLTATFNDNGSSTYAVSGTTATSSGLGLSSVSGGFQTDSEINTAVTQVTAALTSLEGMAQTFSNANTIMSVRQDFTKSMVSFLGSAADSLTATDTNEDGANLLALQTRQQVATTALSLATTSDNAALRLFGLSTTN